jgi:pantoate--beta-alanine ligase
MGSSLAPLCPSRTRSRVLVIPSPVELASYSASSRRQGAFVGLVPTMGALHEGHLELIRTARQNCDRVICSIFVNPLQFNDKSDLDKYPRRLEEDRKMLEEVGCDVLFAPDGSDLFSEHQPIEYDLGGLDSLWEGPLRPGHFQGVVNVVERLFFHARADMAFFGEKDRQQLAVISHVARTLLWPERIIPCPTVREADGLAMSSRNMRLDPSDRQRATVLHKALSLASENAFELEVQEVTRQATRMIEETPGVRLEYFGMADDRSLAPIEEWGDRQNAVALVAAWVGPVRLIDNITLRRKETHVREEP